MSLVDGLNTAAKSLQAFADLLDAVSAQTIRIAIDATSDDRADADAIKRGQKPETLAAMRKALGL
jgi:hypothetical protein